ncbi:MULTISPECIES: hypothetical protein [Aerosakkonema]|uniref:hypothetical protein n=1 Tax=Aerosakkonema TaxID=1246629 RepID=UPI0035B85062
MLIVQPGFFPYTLSEIFARASRSGKISRAEYNRLTLAMMQNCLSEDEQSCIRRIQYAVRRNRIKIVASSHFLTSVADIAS